MAEDFLGISAHFDVSEVLTGFNALIELLEKAGAVSEETAKQMSESLVAMQSNLSNGLTVEGLEQLTTQLSEIRNKVRESIDSLTDVNSSIDTSELTQMVATFNQITSDALNAAQASVEAQSEKLQSLNTQLDELMQRKAELESTGGIDFGLDETISKTKQEVEEGTASLTRFKDLVTSLSEQKADYSGALQGLETAGLVENLTLLIEKLVETGKVSEATGEQMTTAFTTILQNMSENLTPDGLGPFIEQLGVLKDKFLEISQAVDEGSINLNSSDLATFLNSYRDICLQVFSTTQEAYQNEQDNVNRLKEEIGKLAEERQKALSSGANLDEISKYTDKINSLYSQLQDAEKQTKAFSEANLQAKDALAQVQSAIESTAQDALTLENSYAVIGDAIKNGASAVKDWAMGHGKASDAIAKFKEGLTELPGPLGGVVGGFMKMLDAVKLFIKTPIGRVLGVIVFLLQAFKTWLSKSAEGQRVLAKVTAYVGSILESLTDILVRVGGYLYHAFADATGPMNAFARGLVTTLKLAVKSASDLLVGLGDILRGIGKMFTGDWSAGWDTIVNGGKTVAKAFNEARAGFFSAVATGMSGFAGMIKMAGDGISKVWSGNLLSTARNFHNTAMATAQITKERSEAEENITANKEKQLDYEKRINAAKQQAKDTEDKDALKRVMTDLRDTTNEKYNDQIKVLDEEIKRLEKEAKLHTQSLKDITALNVAKLQLYALETKREAALRALDVLEAKQEKKIDRQVEKEKKAEERAEKAAAKKEEREAKAAKREAEREQKKQEREERNAKRKEVREQRLSAQEEARLDKAAAKLGKDLDDYAYDSAKDRIDAEERIESAKLKAMKDGAAKRYKLRQSEHAKELAEIDKRTNERIKKEKDAQFKIWEDAAKTLKKGQKPKPFVLDTKPIEDIRAQGQQEKEFVSQSWDVEELKELAGKYQDYYDQRIEIEEQFNEDISKLQAQRNAAAEREDFDEVERITRMIAKAEKMKGEKLISNTVNEIKNRPENVDAYEDLGKTSAATIRRLIEEWRNAEKAAAAAGLPVKEYRAEIEKLMGQLSKDTPLVYWKTAVEGAKNAKEELEKAKKVLQEVKDEGGQKIYWEKTGPGVFDWSITLVKTADAQKRVKEEEENYAKATEEATQASIKAIGVIDNLRSSFEGLGGSIGGGVGEIVKSIGSIVGSTSSGLKSVMSYSQAAEKAYAAANAAHELGDAAAESGAKMEGASAKANMWMAAISAAFQIIGAVQKLLPTADSLYEKYAEKQKEINNLRRAVEEYKLAVLESQQAEKNWFSVSGLTTLTDAYEKHGKVIEAYYAKLYEAQEKYQNKSAGIKKAVPYLAAVAALAVSVVTLGTAAPAAIAGMAAVLGTTIATATTVAAAGIAAVVGSVVAGLQSAVDTITYKNGQVAAKDNLKIQTRHSTWFRGEKTQDLTQWARENLNAELFDKDGLINLEAAQKILDNYGGKLVGQTKETLEDLVRLREQYNEFMEQVEKYVSDLYSPLVDDMTDALFKWLETGTDVLHMFRENAKDTFAAIAKDMVKQMLLTQVFDKYKEDLKNIYASYAATKNRDILISGVMLATDEFLNKAETELPLIQEALATINEQFAERGFDLSQSSDEGTGAYKAAESFSQEQGDELNGRLAAIQIGQQQGLVQRAAILEAMSLFTVNLGDIQSYTRSLAGDISAMRDMQYNSLQRLSEISAYTSVLPAMASDITDMRNDIRTKL